MAFEEWTSRQDKFQSFFGPGVNASLKETEQVGVKMGAGLLSLRMEQTNLCIELCSTRFAKLVNLPHQGVDVTLVCDGSGQGRGGPEQKDVLPPLMPNMPARRQQ